MRLSRINSPKAGTGTHNHYEILVPSIRFTGIDFKKAYNDNRLYIDTIDIEKPSVIFEKRANKKKNPEGRPAIPKIALLGHEYVKIGHFKLSDAQVKLTDMSSTPEKKYVIDHVSGFIDHVQLDTAWHKGLLPGVHFDRINLQINEFDQNLPDENHVLRFSEFAITTDPHRLMLKDFHFGPVPSFRPESKDELVIDLPQLVIDGFDIGKAVSKDTFELRSVMIGNPQIKVLPAANPATKKDNTEKAGGISGIYSSIRSLARLLSVDRLSIENGQFSLMEPSGSQNEKISLNNVTVDASNIHIDSLTNPDKSLLNGATLSLSSQDSKISLPDGKVALGHIDFSTQPGRLVMHNVTVNTGTQASRLQNQFKFISLTVSGIDPDRIYLDQCIDLDTLSLVLDEIKIHNNSRATDTIKTSGSNAPYLPKVTIKHLAARASNFLMEKDTTTVFKGKNIRLLLSGLLLDQSLSDKFINQFDYKKYDHFSIDDYEFYLTKLKHRLDVARIEWNGNNDSFFIDSISLAPYAKTDNRYNIRVPSVRITGLDLKGLLKGSYYNGKEIIIEKPWVRLSLKKKEGEHKKLTSLDVGFIPILLRNRFLGAESETFKVQSATVVVHQKAEKDSLFLEMDNMNLLVDNFAIDSTTEMSPERFLFANDIRLQGDYLSAYQQAGSNFYNINHFFISTKEKDIRLNGLYYGSNTKNEFKDKGQLRFTAENLSLNDFNFYGLTQNQQVELGEMVVDRARMKIVPPEIRKYPAGKKDMHFDQYLIDTALLKRVDVKQLFVTHSSLTMENAETGENQLVAPDIWVLANDIEYNPVSVHDSTRLFYSDNLITKLANINYVLPDNLSKIRIDEITMNTADSMVQVVNFALIPLADKYDFGPAKGYQTTWLQIENDSITVEDIDFFGLINKNRLDARLISVDGLQVSAFRDKRVPFPEWQRVPLPQVSLKKMKLTLNVDSVVLNGGFINYQEHVEKAFSPGEIFFSDLNAKILNLTNDSLRIISYPNIKVAATADVFGKGHIIANFMFNMVNPENIHTYGVDVDPFDLTEFNRIMIPNASIRITSGQNDKIIMSAKANEKYSYGDMKFYYQGLKISLINRETQKPKGLGNALGSFFANTFIIKSDNPKNFVFRKGIIFYERDERKAIFNYWAKSFLSGVVSSIGAVNNKKKIKKMEKERLKKLQSKETNTKIQ